MKVMMVALEILSLSTRTEDLICKQQRWIEA